MNCYITACGMALPERIVTNAELAPMLGVAPEWIEANSGIRQRRWVQANEAASDLAVAAVQAAIVNAGLKAEQVDYLIGGTLSPDYQVPGIAPLLQRKLAGCRPIPALDIRVGCATILYSLQIARGLIQSQAANNIVCFGAEAQSKGLDLSPRNAELSMLFGDGAGALIVSNQPCGDLALRIDDVLLATDGNFAEDLCVRAPGTGNGARWLDSEQRMESLHLPLMNGRTVILHAVRKLTEAAIALLDRNQLALSQIDLVIPHQANLNLLRALGKKLEISEDRLVINLDRYGNTSSASAFLALSEAQQRMKPGARVLVLAFGAGFTWGAALLTKE